jgi:TM2 domain-containing membrane protein YozV
MAENVTKNADEKFCESCGQIIKSAAEICPKCGVRQKPAGSANGAGKNWLTTLLLCLFLGYLGVHRFYTGHTGIGVVQLLTLGGCGIWALVDFIMIIANSYKDAQGNPLVK